MFGELAAIDGHTRSATVIAKKDSVLASLPTQSFLDLTYSNKEVYLAVLKRLTSQVRHLIDRVYSLSTLKVSDRIRTELLRLAKTHPAAPNRGVISPIPTHAELASRISTHREAVTRELNELARQKVIARTGRDLHILDMIRLGQMDRVVLALGDGQFKSIAVSLGRSDGEYIEILEGVEPGERVVTSAQFLIDSESSKTSDFARLHHGDSDGGQGDGMEMENAETTPQAVSTKATVNTVMADHRMLNVTHAPIEAWGWPQMTMNFDVSENIDLSGLEPGLKVHLDLRDAGSGRYLITAIQILDGTHQDNASNAGGKKEGMNYGGMEAKP